MDIELRRTLKVIRVVDYKLKEVDPECSGFLALPDGAGRDELIEECEANVIVAEMAEKFRGLLELTFKEIVTRKGNIDPKIFEGLVVDEFSKRMNKVIQ